MGLSHRFLMSCIGTEWKGGVRGAFGVTEWKDRKGMVTGRSWREVALCVAFQRLYPISVDRTDIWLGYAQARS